MKEELNNLILFSTTSLSTVHFFLSFLSLLVSVLFNENYDDYKAKKKPESYCSITFDGLKHKNTKQGIKEKKTEK
jgi:hypothetical protein